MSVSMNLADLRQANKCLLERLKVKQEEFRKYGPEDGQSARKTIPLSITETSNQEWRVKTSVNRFGSGDTERGLNRDKDPRVLSMPGRASAARKALCTPIKATQVCRQTPGHSALSQQKVLQGRSLREKKSSTRGRVPNDVVLIQSPEKQACHLNSSEILSQPCTEDKTCDTKPQQYLDRLLDKGNTRHTEAKTPKSILVTPMNKDVKRDAGRVTFLSSNADSTTEYCSAHPFLGYDVIAGLLEITSPISDKSEQFFSDINEFRRVNKEECVHEYYAESEAPDFSASEDEMDLSPDSHQCVYCYRVNSRLFTTPMRLESACPVCKRRRSRRHSTLEEPAYIRVSIPRSTLLPPYKYKAHRRKSFDPTDSLALPSHCLAGWENAVPSCDFNISSLDLKTSLELNTATSVEIGQSNTNHVPHDVSQVRSECLLNKSRSIHFQYSNAK